MDEPSVTLLKLSVVKVAVTDSNKLLDNPKISNEVEFQGQTNISGSWTVMSKVASALIMHTFKS